MKTTSIFRIMTAAILLAGGYGIAAAQDVATVDTRTSATQVVEKQNKMKQAKVVTLQTAKDGQTVEENPDKWPDFPGGQKKLFKWLSANIKYPKEAQANKEQGRVIVRFVIDKDGKVTDAKVVRSISPSLNKEALRLIEAMPRWKPGEKDGQPVAVRFTLPITFRL